MILYSMLKSLFTLLLYLQSIFEPLSCSESMYVYLTSRPRCTVWCCYIYFTLGFKPSLFLQSYYQTLINKLIPLSVTLFTFVMAMKIILLMVDVLIELILHVRHNKEYDCNVIIVRIITTLLKKLYNDFSITILS